MSNRSPQLPKGPSSEMVITIRFTERELEFIKLRFGDNLGLKEIAEKMCISLRTSKAYSTAIINKLGIPNNPHDWYPNVIRITKLLVKHGFLSLEDV